MKAIIIEDEILSRLYLTSLIQIWYSTIEVVATAATSDDAILAIEQWSPDFIFLDIELINGNGFDVIKKLSNHFPKIIFTTALGDHTLKVIKPSGIPFLQKPIDNNDLIEAIEKSVKQSEHICLQQIHQLLQTLANGFKTNSIFIESTENVPAFILLDDIVSIEAKNKYIYLELANGDSLPITNLNLKDCDSILTDLSFCRISQTQIINTIFVEKVNEGLNPAAVFTNGNIIFISPKRVDAFKETLKLK